jgi:His-Xaa-Ser system radical SAM maturase HxsB
LLGPADGLVPIEQQSESVAALNQLAGVFLAEKRRLTPAALDYLILVPTLRCNLACSYCQVSRASQHAKGYDWSEGTLSAVLELVTSLDAPAIKIEFQGGEPTLRPDLLLKVMDAVPEGIDVQFVVCTNLQSLSDEILNVFDREDVVISTSLDGPLVVHAQQRGDPATADRFAKNLAFLLERYGPGKISALPTLDPQSPPEPAGLVDAFASFGFSSIYLRPINYQGFARKNHAASRDIGKAWSDYHMRFIDYLVERNWEDRSMVFEETYFTLLLRRIYRPGTNRHVDLRNPNPVGRDYVVIDYDGKAYPTDEARMLTRSGLIDLAIGDIRSGWNTPEREALDRVSTLDGDPDCEACAYKPYCGRDVIDDISRYGTVSVRRHQTEFCQRHLALFDHAFAMISSYDERVRYSLGRWLDLPGLMPIPEGAA